ncbi:DNA cytosine methyltransferase [Rhizobium pusense]|uniref:DNA cytosine methyltransferase n=1 Tax=Agrobacterium pusense TaxID=648995 RepID=UPI000D199577|nr:DNA cytosine methyltransferase [Agrobacterium pusense]MDH0911154.1 DNA cytosine methyltransferase [Agrobacterium pusense]MDH1097223.1 DNA cytosine methyltransferase [Agrobacterium pusense]MDH1113693.1 DNA cytosine methyltransferase [Agrobacterium pusense]MDH2193215.1 DNA cytosine methyltransferase [Agrobacterium pusense]
MPSTVNDSLDKPLHAVDFFCGAGGMSYGLSQAGLQVLGGVDNDVDCRKTYEANVPNAKYIRHDITTLAAPELGRRLNIYRDDPNLVFAGCSPCQFWSKIRTDKTKSMKTAFLLQQFQRFIKYFRPGYVIVENVPGLYNRKDNSILVDFQKFLRSRGYNFQDGVINANHFGVPQNRMRYVLIASRVVQVSPLLADKDSIALSVADFIGVENGFPPVHPGYRDGTSFQHTTAALSEKNLRRIALTPLSGGDRMSWANDPELQIDAYRGKDTIFRDVYGRMAWDRPAPTITTRFISLSNGRFGHPEENRAISIREGATLQTFPKAYEFHSSNLNALARQIGNAVPPALAKRIGEHLKSVRHG